MKKKIFATMLCVAMLAIAVVGGTWRILPTQILFRM